MSGTVPFLTWPKAPVVKSRIWSDYTQLGFHTSSRSCLAQGPRSFGPQPPRLHSNLGPFPVQPVSPQPQLSSDRLGSVDISATLQWVYVKCHHISKTMPKILQFLRKCPDAYVGGEDRCKLFVEAILWITRSGSAVETASSRVRQVEHHLQTLCPMVRPGRLGANAPAFH